MCLYTSQEKPKTATKPIRCMKVVRRIKGEEGYMPCFNSTSLVNYRIGETVRIYPNEVSDFREPYCAREEIAVGCYVDYAKKGREFYKVTRGLHAYTYGNKNVGRLLALKGTDKYVVLECEIPEGASYYEGHSNVTYSIWEIGFMTETSYCSDSLRVIREVPLSEIFKSGGEKCV